MRGGDLMAFWDEAVDQAGRSFGARYWRWFVGARVARRVLPPLFAALLLGAAGWGAYTLLRWLSPDWTTVGSSAAGVAPGIGRWLLIIGAAVVVLGLLCWAGVALWRAYAWRTYVWRSWRWLR